MQEQASGAGSLCHRSHRCQHASTPAGLVATTWCFYDFPPVADVPGENVGGSISTVHCESLKRRASLPVHGSGQPTAERRTRWLAAPVLALDMGLQASLGCRVRPKPQSACALSKSAMGLRVALAASLGRRQHSGSIWRAPTRLRPAGAVVARAAHVLQPSGADDQVDGSCCPARR
jgi:hypothetical protein